MKVAVPHVVIALSLGCLCHSLCRGYCQSKIHSCKLLDSVLFIFFWRKCLPCQDNMYLQSGDSIYPQEVIHVASQTHELTQALKRERGSFFMKAHRCSFYIFFMFLLMVSLFSFMLATQITDFFSNVINIVPFIWLADLYLSYSFYI